MNNAIVTYLEWKGIAHERASKAYIKPLHRLAEYLNKKVSELTTDDVKKFLKYLKEELPKLSTRGDWRTNFYFHTNVIRDFIKHWNDEGVCNVRPGIIEVPKYSFNPYPSVTIEEFEMMDDYLATEPDNFANLQKRMIIHFLWWTGVRVSELTDLRWTIINQSEQGLPIKNKKNGDIRYIFWPPQTHLLLLRFIRERKQFTGNSLLVTYLGKMHPRCVQRFLENLGKKLGITYHLSPHCFRQGWAKYRLEKGADLKLIKDGLGHTSYDSTDRYLILNYKLQRERAVKYLT